MRGRVIITVPIDAADDADAIDSVLDLLGRALGKHCRTQKAVRAWLREQAEIRFEPDPAPAIDQEV